MLCFQLLLLSPQLSSYALQIFHVAVRVHFMQTDTWQSQQVLAEYSTSEGSDIASPTMCQCRRAEALSQINSDMQRLLHADAKQ